MEIMRDSSRWNVTTGTQMEGGTHITVNSKMFMSTIFRDNGPQRHINEF